jgi:hypothetical protein
MLAIDGPLGRDGTDLSALTHYALGRLGTGIAQTSMAAENVERELTGEPSPLARSLAANTKTAV